MSDLIEKLRNRDAVVLSGLFHAVPTMAEAADEIERLRAQLATATKALEETNYFLEPLIRFWPTVNIAAEIERNKKALATIKGAK